MNINVHLQYLMRLIELITALDRWDQSKIWAFHSNTLALIFPENNRARLKALAAHVDAGIITHISRGLYINPRAKSLPADLLAALVPFLRPWAFNYLSLESALSEAGFISQIPSRLTVMTTGRRQTFETSYGTIEFVHTEQSIESLRRQVKWDSRRRLAIATPDRARSDLKRVGRNVELLSIGDFE